MHRQKYRETIWAFFGIGELYNIEYHLLRILFTPLDALRSMGDVEVQRGRLGMPSFPGLPVPSGLLSSTSLHRRTIKQHTPLPPRANQ